MKKIKILVGALAILSLGATAIVTLSACERVQNLSDINVSSNTSTALASQLMTKGVFIGEVDASNMSVDEAIKACEDYYKAKSTPDYHLTLSLDDNNYAISQNDISLDYDIVTSVQQAFKEQSGLTNALAQEESEVSSGVIMSDGTIHYAMNLALNDAELDSVIEQMSKDLTQVAHEPKITGYDKETKKIIVEEGSGGIAIDKHALAKAITEAVESGTTTKIEVPYTEKEPSLSAETLREQYVLLGEYSTTSTNNANGNSNMKLALSHCDGTILQPGDIFSYHETIGNSTLTSNGYLPAGSIVGGKLVNEIGGGICQASSTLYGAVMRSDLEIVERYNHAWPLGYVPTGQDATVNWGTLDFRFKNNKDAPIYIAAYMEGTKLNVMIFGKPSDEFDRIEINTAVSSTIAQPAAQYVESESLGVGVVVKDKNGRSGVRCETEAVYYKDDKVVKRKAMPSSYYPPAASVYRYGKGTPFVDGKPVEGSAQTSETTSQTTSEDTSSQNSEAFISDINAMIDSANNQTSQNSYTSSYVSQQTSVVSQNTQSAVSSETTNSYSESTVSHVPSDGEFFTPEIIIDDSIPLGPSSDNAPIVPMD